MWLEKRDSDILLLLGGSGVRSEGHMTTGSTENSGSAFLKVYFKSKDIPKMNLNCMPTLANLLVT